MKKTRLGKGIRISDHAMLRWLERVDGMDMNKLKQEMKRAGKSRFLDGDLVRYLRDWHKISKHLIRPKMLTKEIKQLVQTGIEYVPIKNRQLFLVVIDRGDEFNIATIKRRHNK